MKSYIGTKIVLAEPMDRVTFEKQKYPESNYGGENMHGYRVVYPDGYVSWSPKDVFESAYREISDYEKKLI